MFKTNLVEELKKLLPRRQSKKFYAEKLGIGEKEVSDLLKEIRLVEEMKELKGEYVEAVNYAAELQESLEIAIDNNKGTRKSEVISDYEPKDDVQLAQLHKVDLTKYKISNYWTKQRGDKFYSSLLCTLRKPEDITPEELLSVLSSYTSTYKPLTKINILVNDVYTEPCSAFIDLTDFHLGKKELQGTTLEEKKKVFFGIVDKLLYRAYKSHKLEEIVFIVGSDFFHTDNQTVSISGNTEKGTPQETMMYWFDEYTEGFDMNATVIQKLKQFCDKLKVILVQGNHDRTKSFYLAHALSKYFSTDSSIEFDISPEPRKVHIYGNTFIGLHHGDCKSLEKLPLTFAQQFSAQWGPCKFKEIKVGDKHHYMEKEIDGVRIKQLPSLSGTDTWHSSNNYHLATRAAICSIYHPVKGRVSEFEERI